MLLLYTCSLGNPTVQLFDCAILLKMTALQIVAIRSKMKIVGS